MPTIEEQFATYPETKITFIDFTTNKRWPEWRKYNECSPEERATANLRAIFPNEIILDIEDKTRTANIVRDLKEKNMPFSCWSTGSRGSHIHLFYSDLAQLELPLRNRIRKIIINTYECDLAKSTEGGLIAEENKPHFKTQQYKVLLEKVDGLCTICDELMEKAKLEVNNEILLLKQVVDVQQETFKDYHIKDKLFLYFKDGHILANQQRNNILFKNFAAALVYEGLTDEQIKGIIEPILDLHYSDKKYAEFKGWVEKVRKKEIDNYNIFELNEWSRTFNHPIFYEDIKDVNEIASSLSISQLWNAYWDTNIAGQPFWKKLCLYNLLGTILDERELDDLRIHVAFSSMTSTGKDEGVNLTQDILHQLNYNAQACFEITDRTLVGAVNSVIKAENDKYGLNMPGDTINVRGREIEFRNPIEYGIIKDYHHIAFPECQNVLNPGAFNKSLQTILRQIMDKKREVGKGVGGKMIQTTTNSTLLMTTYPLKIKVLSLLDTGLFQRMLYFDCPMTDELHEAIVKKMIDSMNVVSIKNKTSIYRNNLIKKLEELKSYWDSEKETYYTKAGAFFDDKIKTYFKQKEIETRITYKFLDKESKQNLDAIMRRGLTIVRRLALIDSLITTRNMTIKNIDTAFDIFSNCMSSVINLIWGGMSSRYIISKVDTKIAAMVSIIQYYGNKNEVGQYEISLDSFNKYLCSIQMCSPNIRVHWTKILETEGYIKRVVTEYPKQKLILLKEIE